MAEDQKKESDELAYTSFNLYFLDVVLRKAGKLDSTKELWKKFGVSYLLKSTSNKIFLFERFFSFKIESSKTLDNNLDIFNKLLQDIIDCGEKVPLE